jgi:hypothetical protein
MAKMEPSKLMRRFVFMVTGFCPDEISKLLNLTPSKSGVAESGFGIWNYSTKDLLDNLLPLEQHIVHLIKLVEPRSEMISNLRQRYRMEVFCYFASQSDLGGFHLFSDAFGCAGAIGSGF